MSFVTECPFCSHRVQVPEKGYAASISCPKCKDGYTAVPVVDEVSTADGDVPEPITMSVAVQAKPQKATKSTPKMGLPATASASAAKSEPESLPTPTFTPISLPDTPAVDEEEESESALPPLHWVSAGSLLLAGVAVVAATVRSLCLLVLPFALVGLLLGIAGAVSLYKSQVSRLLSGAGAAVSAFLVLFAIVLPSFLGPIYDRYASEETVDPNIVQVVPFPGRANTDVTYETVGVDAEKAALKKGNLWMRVSRVTLDQEKRNPAAKNAPPGKSYLVVRLLVQRVGSGSEFSDEATWTKFTNQQQPQVKLLDSSGTKSYSQVQPGDLNLKPKSQTTGAKPEEPAADLFLISATDPTFYFAVPNSDDPFLQLVVSLSAWGQDGEFRFKIPKSMIQSAKNLPLLNVP